MAWDKASDESWPVQPRQVVAQRSLGLTDGKLWLVGPIGQVREWIVAYMV